MSAKFFLDTNIFIYADSPAEPAKQAVAMRLIYTEDLQHGQTFDNLRVQNPFL